MALRRLLTTGRAKGDVGHEMAVHDIDMDNGAAAALGGGHLVGQVGEIGRKNGGKQFNHDFSRP